MATVNEAIRDAFIGHQSYLLRWVGGLRNELTPKLVATEDALLTKLLQILNKVPPGEMEIWDASTRAVITAMESDIAAVRAEAWDDIAKVTQAAMTQLATAEAASTAAFITGAVPVQVSMGLPAKTHLQAVVRSQPFEGKTLAQWIKRTGRADAEAIARVTKVGISQGLTPTEITRQIMGTSRNRRNAVSRKAFHNLESVLLTVANGVQSQSKAMLYDANADLISQEYFVATLDSRTTFECAGLDERVYPRGKGPMPPLHFRCRSIRVPYIDPDYLVERPFNAYNEREAIREFSKSIGIDPVKNRGALPRGTKTKFDKFARDYKRKLVGTVPGETTFNDFFKNRTAAFQRDYLGETRYKMFKENKMDIRNFTTPTGRTLTIEELVAKGYKLPGE